MKFLAAILLTAGLWGQTRITPPQLRLSTAATPRLLALIDGKFQTVDLGPGMAITATNTGFVISVTGIEVPVAPIAWNAVKLTRAADGTYADALPGSLVFRNGVLQAPADYTLDGTTVKPSVPWDAEDSITAVSVGYMIPPSTAAGATRVTSAGK